MLPLSARGNEYARLIAKIYRDEQKYAELVRSTRAAFDERLNWDAWGMSVTRLIAEVLEPKSSDHGASNFRARLS
jgi:hypothetical protein